MNKRQYRKRRQLENAEMLRRLAVNYVKSGRTREETAKLLDVSYSQVAKWAEQLPINRGDCTSEPFACDSYEPKLIPSEPTSFRNGSKERIEVMRARLERGEEIRHPDDEPLAKDHEGAGGRDRQEPGIREFFSIDIYGR